MEGLRSRVERRCSDCRIFSTNSPFLATIKGTVPFKISYQFLYVKKSGCRQIFQTCKPFLLGSLVDVSPSPRKQPNAPVNLVQGIVKERDGPVVQLQSVARAFKYAGGKVVVYDMVISLHSASPLHCWT